MLAKRVVLRKACVTSRVPYLHMSKARHQVARPSAIKSYVIVVKAFRCIAGCLPLLLLRVSIG